MTNRSRSPTIKQLNKLIERRTQNMTVKALFNVTHIVYTLVKLEDGELKTVDHTETLLHKRTETNINNYLRKKVKETNSVGYDIKEIKTEKIISEIPYKIALIYKL